MPTDSGSDGENGEQTISLPITAETGQTERVINPLTLIGWLYK